MSSISVVINNYNYARFLPQAVAAARAQLAPGDHIVIVDDGSSDRSGQVLDDYAAEPAVQVIRQSNQGQLAAVLNGLAAARGDLLVLLDSDDYFLPGYLDRLRGLAAHHPEVDFFFAAAQPDGDCAPAAIEQMRRLLARMELTPGVTGLTRWSTLYTGEFVGTPTSGLALRRRLAERLVAARERLPDRMKISDLACRLLRLPRAAHSTTRLSADGIIVRAASVLGAHKHYCPEPGFYYRIHADNAYARINRLGRFYMRLVRSRQIARLLREALPVPLPPATAAVVAEARARSQPRHRRRRLRLALNYGYATLRSAGRPADKLRALGQIARARLMRR